jgi:hypothetical protein
VGWTRANKESVKDQADDSAGARRSGELQGASCGFVRMGVPFLRAATQRIGQQNWGRKNEAAWQTFSGPHLPASLLFLLLPDRECRRR